VYALAQRVASPTGTAHGINTFLHLHGDPVESIDWGDIEYITNLKPGRLIDQETEVQPGGNRVLSYLEVVGPDNALPIQLTTALDHVQLHLSYQPNWIWQDHGLLIRFSFGFPPPNMDDLTDAEFTALREHMEAIVSRFDEGNFPQPAPLQRRPLLIWRKIAEDGMEFFLDETSRKTIKALVSERVFPTTIKVEHLVKYEFERQFGTTFESMIPALVGLPHSKVISLGGLELRDRNTKELLLRWTDETDVEPPLIVGPAH